jgi:hypothetical protein
MMIDDPVLRQIDAEISALEAQLADGHRKITIRRVVVAPCWDHGSRRPNRVVGVYRHVDDGALVAEDVSAEEMARLTEEANERFYASFDDEQPDIEDRDAIADSALARAAQRIAALRARQ